MEGMPLDPIAVVAAPPNAQSHQVTLMTGNCVDRQAIAAGSQMVLEQARLLDDRDLPLGHFADTLWMLPQLATSWVRFEGELFLSFEGEQVYRYHRSLRAIDLIGLTLWGPNRSMLAYYSQFANCWIDRGGFECSRIVIAAQPHPIEPAALL